MASVPALPSAVPRGAAAIMAGMFLLGFTDNLVRLISTDIGLWQFHFLRSLMALPMIGLAALALGLSLAPIRRWRFALRCAVQAAAMLVYFGAIGFMPLTQVVAGFFTAPLFVLLYTTVWFRTRIGPRRIAAVGLGFLGTLIMLRPDPSDLQLATFVPVLAGALWGLSNVLTREWCANEPMAALVAGFFVALGIAGAVMCLILSAGPPPGTVDFLTRPWAAPTAPVLFWVAVQAVGSLAAMGCLTLGYQSGETSSLTVYEYFLLISASFWGGVLWGESVQAAGWLAIALIIASGVLIARSSTAPRAG